MSTEAKVIPNPTPLTLGRMVIYRSADNKDYAAVVSVPPVDPDDRTILHVFFPIGLPVEPRRATPAVPGEVPGRETWRWPDRV